MNRAKSVAAMLSVLLLAACDGGPAGPTALQIAIVSGDGQVAPAGTMLGNPLLVRVTGSDEKPVRGAIVRWEVHESGGAVTAEILPSFTDASGYASVRRVLGPGAGLRHTTATVEGYPDVAVRFASVSQVQGATQLVLHPHDHGNNQVDTVLATLSPYSVLVLDQNDLPVEGVNVSWSTVVDAGSVSARSGTTNPDGVSQTIHTLGSTAHVPQRVFASVPGLIGSPVTFEAIAYPGTPAILIPEDTVRRIGEVNIPVEPYRVLATDSYGNPVSNVVIDWTVTSGEGWLEGQQNRTDADPGEGATAEHRLGPDEGIHTVTATAPELPAAPSVTFTARAVTSLVRMSAPDPYYCSYYYAYESCDPFFGPDQVTIQAGKTVGWAWNGWTECDVIFEDDPAPPVSSLMQKSGHHVRTFIEEGTYRYRCTKHSTDFATGMVGKVVVE